MVFLPKVAGPVYGNDEGAEGPDLEKIQHTLPSYKT